MGWFKRLIGKEVLDTRDEYEVIDELCSDRSFQFSALFQEQQDSELVRKLLCMVMKDQIERYVQESGGIVLVKQNTSKCLCPQITLVDSSWAYFAGGPAGRTVLYVPGFKIHGRPCHWRDQKANLLDRRMKLLHVLATSNPKECVRRLNAEWEKQ